MACSHNRRQEGLVQQIGHQSPTLMLAKGVLGRHLCDGLLLTAISFYMYITMAKENCKDEPNTKLTGEAFRETPGQVDLSGSSYVNKEIVNIRN